MVYYDIKRIYIISTKWPMPRLGLQNPGWAGEWSGTVWISGTPLYTAFGPGQLNPSSIIHCLGPSISIAWHIKRSIIISFSTMQRGPTGMTHFGPGSKIGAKGDWTLFL